ncbi:hypothetical protein GCM10010483_47820 [Actinokineospora diospyrosa]
MGWRVGCVFAECGALDERRGSGARFRAGGGFGQGTGARSGVLGCALGERWGLRWRAEAVNRAVVRVFGAPGGRTGRCGLVVAGGRGADGRAGERGRLAWWSAECRGPDERGVRRGRSGWLDRAGLRSAESEDRATTGGRCCIDRPGVGDLWLAVAGTALDHLAVG